MSPVCLYSKEDIISNMPKMILMTLIIIIMIIWHFHFWYGKGICLQCNLFFFIIICFDRCRIQTLRKCWQTWIAVNCFGYLVDSWRSPWRRRVRILGKSLASSRAGNLVTVSVCCSQAPLHRRNETIFSSCLHIIVKEASNTGAAKNVFCCWSWFVFFHLRLFL